MRRHTPRFTPQTPARIAWEEAVVRVMGEADICRSDAQATIETDKGAALLNALYDAGVEPALAAQRFID